MPQSRTFSLPHARLDSLVNEMRAWFQEQKFECQKLTTENNGYVLQVQKKGAWRNFVGMSTALNVAFFPLDNIVKVEVGAGRWIDKASVGTVSFFILWPLAVTSAFGAWDQMRMPERVFDRVARITRTLASAQI